MTVNITKNALNSQAKTSITGSSESRHVLNKLSSGVALPDAESGRNSAASIARDSTAVSSEASNMSSEANMNIKDIATMQDDVNKLDTIQTALEQASLNLWGIEEQLNSEHNIMEEASESVLDTQTEESGISADTSSMDDEKAKIRQTTDKYLEGIDHTGSELMDYLSEFIDKYSLDINISTTELGKTEDGKSLASLREDVNLSSDKASEILSKAQEEIASYQVSTEMHRSNLLNDIGMAIETIASAAEQPLVNKGVENSIQEISELLMNTPEAVSSASQINMTHATSLLLS